MVILGLLLILLGAIAIVGAVFTSPTTDPGVATFLGLHLNSVTVFFVGVAAGAAILWGYAILKYGTKRGLAQRRERKKLEKLSEQLDATEAARRREGEG